LAYSRIEGRREVGFKMGHVSGVQDGLDDDQNVGSFMFHAGGNLNQRAEHMIPSAEETIKV